MQADCLEMPLVGGAGAHAATARIPHNAIVPRPVEHDPFRGSIDRSRSMFAKFSDRRKAKNAMMHQIIIPTRISMG